MKFFSQSFFSPSKKIKREKRREKKWYGSQNNAAKIVRQSWNAYLCSNYAHNPSTNINKNFRVHSRTKSEPTKKHWNPLKWRYQIEYLIWVMCYIRLFEINNHFTRCGRSMRCLFVETIIELSLSLELMPTNASIGHFEAPRRNRKKRYIRENSVKMDYNRTIG